MENQNDLKIAVTLIASVVSPLATGGFLAWAIRTWISSVNKSLSELNDKIHGYMLHSNDRHAESETKIEVLRESIKQSRIAAKNRGCNHLDG